MKKLALTNFILLLAIKFVSACDYSPEYKDEYLQILAERDFNVKLFFFSSIFLIAANIVLFFFRNKKDYWLLITIITVVFISVPATFISGFIDMCGDSIVTGLQVNFFVFLSFLTYQILLWVNRTSLQFKRGKITTIDLR